MTVSAFIYILINGLFIGSVYGLFASGFTFQLGCLSVYNFSFGSWLILSMYLTFFFIRIWNVGIVLMIIIMLVFFFVMGYLVRRYILKKGTMNTHIIATIGIGMIINGIILITFTPRTRSLGYTEPMFEITPDLRIGLYRLLIFFLAAVIMFSFHAFLKRTTLGKTIRAVTEKYETSKLMGINSSNIINVAFGISFVLMAVSGMMMMIMYPVTFGASDSYMLMSFLIASLAGLGNMKGAFFVGLIVGVMGALLQFIVSSFGDVILYMIIIFLLIARPQDLFSRAEHN